MWVQFKGELASLIMSVPFTPLHVFEISHEVLSTNSGHRVCLEQPEAHECTAQWAREAADEKLAKVRSNTNDVVELRKLLAASVLSMRALDAEITKVKAQKVQLSAENAELSTKIGAVATESDQRFERLVVVNCARVRAERLVRSMFGQFFEALDLFAYQVEAQLVDRFCFGFEGACAGSQLVYHYMVVHVSDFGAISMGRNRSAVFNMKGVEAAAMSSTTTIPSRPYASSR